jgi:hypothetical protein
MLLRTEIKCKRKNKNTRQKTKKERNVFMPNVSLWQKNKFLINQSVGEDNKPVFTNKRVF